MPDVAGQLQRLGIFEGGQATIGDLKIGAGNFGIETYRDQDNVEREGLTCGLWFFVRDQDALNCSQRVYPGAVIEIAGYQVSVDGVEQGRDQSHYVLLTVTMP